MDHCGPCGCAFVPATITVTFWPILSQRERDLDLHKLLEQVEVEMRASISAGLDLTQAQFERRAILRRAILAERGTFRVDVVSADA